MIHDVRQHFMTVHCTACLKYFGQCLVCGVDLGQIMQNKDSWPSKSELCRLERKIAFWEYSSRQYLENVQEVSLSLSHIWFILHRGVWPKWPKCSLSSIDNIKRDQKMHQPLENVKRAHKHSWSWPPLLDKSMLSTHACSANIFLNRDQAQGTMS